MTTPRVSNQVVSPVRPCEEARHAVSLTSSKHADSHHFHSPLSKTDFYLSPTNQERTILRRGARHLHRDQAQNNTFHLTIGF